MSVPGTNVATMLFGNHTGNNNLTLYEKRDTTNMTIVRLKKEGVLGTRISGIDSGDYVNVLSDTGKKYELPLGLTSQLANWQKGRKREKPRVWCDPRRVLAGDHAPARLHIVGAHEDVAHVFSRDLSRKRLIIFG